MLKSKAILSILFLFCICGMQNISSAQNLSTTRTYYSKSGKGSIGKENFSFSMSNGNITITDLDYNRSETYGPLKFKESGFDENGYYYDTYNSDILKDPAGWIRSRKKPRLYKLLYESKNGDLLAVMEAKVEQDNSTTSKIYYTEKGNSLLSAKQKSNTISQNNSSFDLTNILLNATSLSQIATKVLAAFTKDTEKKYSTDMSYYSFNFKNNSTTTVIVSYATANDEVNRIFFLLPKHEAVQVEKESFISRFKQKFENGNAVWVNDDTGLTYEAGYDGEVGIIVVR